MVLEAICSILRNLFSHRYLFTWEVTSLNKVKSAPGFIKELEIFHFGEISFHRNDSQGKVAAHKATHKVNFEYTDYR